jgi:hypothetical protein
MHIYLSCKLPCTSFHRPILHTPPSGIQSIFVQDARSRLNLSRSSSPTCTYLGHLDQETHFSTGRTYTDLSQSSQDTNTILDRPKPTYTSRGQWSSPTCTSLSYVDNACTSLCHQAPHTSLSWMSYRSMHNSIGRPIPCTPISVHIYPHIQSSRLSGPISASLGYLVCIHLYRPSDFT